ncbi:MAG: hypothetical protein MMC33_003404 [Icmadophila ericetorum]|nr:hypothetical protein [Icmadophila ericetorum]
MLLAYLLLSLAGLQTAFSAPIAQPNLPLGASTGFSSYSVGLSAGGEAACISGNVPVTINATTVNLLLAEPTNQTVVTEIIQELFQNNSTIGQTTFGGYKTTQGTYHIDSTLCFPNNGSKAKTVQVLVHGIGLDKSYWDIAPGYSYVDAAAAAGYATLAYNRLGVGNSDHPDPIQVVQAAVDVEVQHGIVQLLRLGLLGTGGHDYVIGVGHSYGSIIQLAQNGKYPADVDAAVLTGFTDVVTNLQFTVIANNPAIANVNNASKWGGLPNGYLVHDTSISIQLPFFRFPFFANAIFDNQVAAKQTYSLGQQFTLPLIFAPATNFTGPVDVVVGLQDFPFCKGDCLSPSDQAVTTIPSLYPAASKGSQSFIVPDSGHFINAHYNAPLEFEQINKFLTSNSL